MKESLVTIDNLTITIGLKTVFKSMSFSIYEGESVLLTGENGSGKSTLLKAIFGGQDKKQIHWNKKSERDRVSYLGHELGLYTSLTLEENLEYFSRISKKPISKTKLIGITERFGLEKRVKDPVHTYSEGMKRKAGVIRALLVDAELLLMDEPFNGLDSNSVGILFNLLMEVGKSTTFIIVSHDAQNIKSIVNRHLHIQHGRISEIND
jgi:heme exporter protein A